MNAGHEHASHRVLIVDDDPVLCAMLQDYLSRHQLQVEAVPSAELALQRLLPEAQPPDILVLDLMLPGMDGLSALRRIRSVSQIPVLMLSSRGESMDRVIGLEMGADDYLSKPCVPREVLARIGALLRRTRQPPADGELRIGELRLQGGDRRAWLGGRELELTGAEFSVLQVLMLRQGQVVSREELTERALHRPLERFDRALDVHISRLRQKLSGAGSPLIEAVRGAGYIIRDPSGD